MQGTDCGQGVFLISRPRIWDALDQIIGVSLNQMWATTAQISKWRTGITEAIAAFDYTTTPKPKK